MVEPRVNARTGHLQVSLCQTKERSVFYRGLNKMTAILPPDKKQDVVSSWNHLKAKGRARELQTTGKGGGPNQ